MFDGRNGVPPDPEHQPKANQPPELAPQCHPSFAALGPAGRRHLFTGQIQVRPEFRSFGFAHQIEDAPVIPNQVSVVLVLALAQVSLPRFAVRFPARRKL
jgi:hypothetical protein